MERWNAHQEHKPRKANLRMKPIGRSQLWKKHLGHWGSMFSMGVSTAAYLLRPVQPGVRAQPFWAGKTQEDWGHHFVERVKVWWTHSKNNCSRSSRARAMETSWGQGRILVSFLCDPHQPLEERLGVTRRVLDFCWRQATRSASRTRATLVRRDFDLLRKYKDQVRLGTSLPHLNDDLAQVLEPKAAAPTAPVGNAGRGGTVGDFRLCRSRAVLPFHSLEVLDEIVARVTPATPHRNFLRCFEPQGELCPKGRSSAGEIQSIRRQDRPRL